MTNEIPTPDFRDDLTVQSLPLEVRCYDLSDRVGHSIYLRDKANHWREVLRSVEGDGEDESPPSGPMQEIVSEVVSVGRPATLLGIGAAGKSHWSCSIEGDTTIESIAFDFACKTRAATDFGSTYQLQNNVVCQVSDSRKIELTCNQCQNLSLRCFGNATIQYNAATRQIIILATSPDPNSNPTARAQRRWRYAIGLAASLSLSSDA